MLHRLKSDQDEIWQDFSPCKIIASADGVRFSIWRHTHRNHFGNCSRVWRVTIPNFWTALLRVHVKKCSMFS